MNNTNDEAASEFEEWYLKYLKTKSSHEDPFKISMEKSFQAGRASREFKLPSDKIDYWIDNTNRLPNYNLNAMFHYVHEMVKFLNEIKTLNECDGESEEKLYEATS